VTGGSDQATGFHANWTPDLLPDLPLREYPGSIGGFRSFAAIADLHLQGSTCDAKNERWCLRARPCRNAVDRFASPAGVRY
jgi:hypothetical protein